MLRNEILKALRLDEKGLYSGQADIKKLIEFVIKVYGKPYQEINNDPNDKTELTEEQLTTLKCLLVAANPDPKSLPEEIIYKLRKDFEEAEEAAIIASKWETSLVLVESPMGTPFNSCPGTPRSPQNSSVVTVPASTTPPAGPTPFWGGPNFSIALRDVEPLTPPTGPLSPPKCRKIP